MKKKKKKEQSIKKPRIWLLKKEKERNLDNETLDICHKTTGRIHGVNFKSERMSLAESGRST